MQRRDFIKFGSLLTAAAALPTPLVSGILRDPKESPLKIGILGYGDRGSGLHNVLTGMPEKFKVTAICDNVEFRLENAKKRFGTNEIGFFSDYRKFLEAKNLDIVLVATPLYLHFEHAKAVLEAGKHLYLEKSMAFAVDQTLKLSVLSKNFPKQVIQIGHQYRYSPLYFKVKGMIEKGYLGNITQIDARWDRNHNWRRPVPNVSLERQINWRMYKEYSGGLVAELLSHQMDFVHWAFDCVPSEIYGIGGIDHFKDGRETFDNVQVAVRYEKEGMVGNFGATCANQYEGYSLKIKGSKGMVNLLTNDGIYYPEPETRAELEQVDGVSGATKLVWAEGKKGINLLDGPLKDGSFYALEDFHRCLLNNELPHSNITNGGRTAIAVALANKSLYDGNKQIWKPEYNLG